MNRMLIVGLGATLLSGCVTPSTILVNEDGKVVRCAAHGWGYVGAPMAQGIASSCVNDARKMGFVEVPDAYLGLHFKNPDHAARVTNVEAGSPAAVAGIKQGDLVTRFDGQPIGNSHEVIVYLGKKKPGDPIKVSIERDGKPMELAATLKSRSS